MAPSLLVQTGRPDCKPVGQKIVKAQKRASGRKSGLQKLQAAGRCDNKTSGPGPAPLARPLACLIVLEARARELVRLTTILSGPLGGQLATWPPHRPDTLLLAPTRRARRASPPLPIRAPPNQDQRRPRAGPIGQDNCSLETIKRTRDNKGRAQRQSRAINIHHHRPPSPPACIEGLALASAWRASFRSRAPAIQAGRCVELALGEGTGPCQVGCRQLGAPPAWRASRACRRRPTLAPSACEIKGRGAPGETSVSI